MKKLSEMTEKEITNEMREILKNQGGFTDQEAETAQKNLHTLSKTLAFIDSAILALPVDLLERFNGIYHKHKNEDSFLQEPTQKVSADRLEAITAIAKAYQERFAGDDSWGYEPVPPMMRGKPVMC